MVLLLLKSIQFKIKFNEEEDEREEEQEDGDEDDDGNKNLLHNPHIQRCVPLCANNEAVGRCTIYFTKPAVF